MVSMLPVVLAASTFFSTLLGGYVALKNVRWINNILGFTAGVLLGVVAFDVLPEIFHVAGSEHIDITLPMITLTIGFLLFHIVEKVILMRHSHESEYGAHSHPQVGVVSALALIGHSFLDGVAIGVGFQASEAIGITVALAIIAHDFSDGLNTVSLLLAHKNKRSRAVRFLVLDAIAPVLGAASTLLFTASSSVLVMYLGFFAGFLLYIGASDILPQAHSKGSSWKTIGLTIFGVLFIFVVTRLA